MTCGDGSTERPPPGEPATPEVIRFDPDADPARPGTIYGRLLDDLRSGRLAEMRRRSLPMAEDARAARLAADAAASGDTTLALGAALAEERDAAAAPTAPRFRDAAE